MRIGTKSILFGAHCFFLHPWFVAWAWWRLYGFPWDPRLWVAFFIHDLGYWGSPNMDGPEGERHPEWAARLMSRWFDSVRAVTRIPGDGYPVGRWGAFVLYHSRYYAKRDGAQPSRLCIADKLAICLTPAWLYLPLARATGEIHEYMRLAERRAKAGEPLRETEAKYASMELDTSDQRRWYREVQDYLRRWVEEHCDGREDTWTPDVREARDDSGVWR